MVQKSTVLKIQQDDSCMFPDIHQYLISGCYPAEFCKSSKQALRKRAKFFLVKEIQLSYIVLQEE